MQYNLKCYVIVGIPESAIFVIEEITEVKQADLVTKQNLEVTKLELQKEIQQVKLELQKEIQQVKLELQKEIEVVRKEIEVVRERNTRS